MENNKYFYCYSAKLRRFLNENGIRWINKGINPKNECPFWVFVRDCRFNKVITEYNK